MTVRNGWTLYAHPNFTAEFDRLTAAVEAEGLTTFTILKTSANKKLLSAINHLILNVIPQDPTRTDYRQGNTLGAAHRHWFRAKFGSGRFRLFFRYNLKAKIIIYAWVNDETTLRTYGSKTDDYAVFKAMLGKGNPPGDWAELLEACDSSNSR